MTRHSDTIARRVTLLHELGARADWAHRLNDRAPVIDLERALKIGTLHGEIAGLALTPSTDPDRLRTTLVRVGGEVLAWLEHLDEEAAR